MPLRGITREWFSLMPSAAACRDVIESSFRGNVPQKRKVKVSQKKERKKERKVSRTTIWMIRVRGLSCQAW